METQITTAQQNKLEQLHDLLNNEVTGPSFYEYLEMNVPKDYDSNEYWSPYINLFEYITSNINDNVFNITSDTEVQFFMYCIFNDDYEAFIQESNFSNSTEKDWEMWVNKYLTLITK